MKESNLNILDCTLRDGGYYNRWDFSYSIVERYLNAIEESYITHVEIGFRFKDKKSFLGPYAYSSELTLKNLVIPERIKLGVMVNSSDFKTKNVIDKQLFESLFVDKKNSRIQFVRIASHILEIENSLKLSKILKQKGYSVIINVMQSGLYDNSTLTKISKRIYDEGSVDVLYFADSLGNMNINDISRVLDALRKGWGGNDIGIHAHNNLGQALSNSNFAIKNGINWVDSTICGMGRGAGNTPTEELLLDAFKNDINLFDKNEKLFDIASNDFKNLKMKYSWGPNFLYKIAAEKKIHPTYVQQMISDKRYETKDILKVLLSLDENESKSYSLDKLKINLFSKKQKLIKSKWSSKSLKFNKPVLILVSGDSLNKYNNYLKELIHNSKLTVFSINYNQQIESDYIDFYCACHPTRIIAEKSHYLNSKKPLIAPLENFSKKELIQFNNINVYNYGLEVTKSKTISITEHGVKMISPDVLTYLFSLLKSAGYKQFYIAGLDGHKNNESLNSYTRNEIDDFQKQNKDISITSITPTIYNLRTHSLFSNEIFKKT